MASTLHPALRENRRRLLLFVAAALVFVAAWFGSLELRGLFIPDEGRYAEIPREMTASGDWITPRLNDLKYFEKPPLQYWMTAVSFRVFGEDEWTARLPAALLGFLSLLMVGFAGYRVWDARSGMLAAVMLGGSWAYFLAGQYLTLDMTLTACLTFALCAFLLAHKAGATSRPRSWMLAAWAAMALAVLSKGLIGVVLPGLALCGYIACKRDMTILRRLEWVRGGLLFLCIAVPWFVIVQQRNPEFFDFFFIQEHLKRFADPGHNRPGAWWYYAPVLLVGLLPWSPALLKAGIDTWRQRGPRSESKNEDFSPTLFCALWATVIVLFFSASHSKLPAYILPAWPALMLLFASRAGAWQSDVLKWSAWGVSLFGVALIGLVSLLPGWKKFAVLGQDVALQLPWLYAAAGVLLASGIAALWSAYRRMFITTVTLLVAGTFGFWQLTFGFLYKVDDSLSAEGFIESLLVRDGIPAEERLRESFHPELPFYSVEQFDDSVPFYLGRTLTLVNYRDELGPGIDAEPAKTIASTEAFEQVWRDTPGQAYAIMKRGVAERLRAEGLPMHNVMANQRLEVVSRQPDPGR